ILLPEVARLDAVVLGGDRRAIERLRGDGKLAPVFDRAVERFLTVPEPRLAILRGTPRLFRSARVMLEPAEEQRR
ncbi:MAG TPA: Vms1/Ankzf1 family peptidyl-tRNA hydrolase, partial [Actinomycetes bacterium]|nr:Vms1/Ankzf1 family peptidyl-tRNA hydrolase [Actinomycetes bacterium]